MCSVTFVFHMEITHDIQMDPNQGNLKGESVVATILVSYRHVWGELLYLRIFS